MSAVQFCPVPYSSFTAIIATLWARVLSAIQFCVSLAAITVRELSAAPRPSLQQSLLVSSVQFLFRNHRHTLDLSVAFLSRVLSGHLELSDLKDQVAARHIASLEEDLQTDLGFRGGVQLLQERRGHEFPIKADSESSKPLTI
jgi:hypothetical protein